MSAELLYCSKVHLVHKSTDVVTVAELKVWRVPKNKDFPEGIKYSLFLVNPRTGSTIIGYDNHKPKGHHIHILDTEQSYQFRGVEQLIDDFWSAVEEGGLPNNMKAKRESSFSQLMTSKWNGKRR